MSGQLHAPNSLTPSEGATALLKWTFYDTGIHNIWSEVTWAEFHLHLLEEKAVNYTEKGYNT